jgi:hypothetical protein
MDHFRAQVPVAKETPVDRLQPIVVLLAVAAVQAVPVAQLAEQLVVPQGTDYPAASQELQPSMPLAELALAQVHEVQPDHQAVSQRSPMQQLAPDQAVAVVQGTVHISRQGSAVAVSSS